MTGSTIGRLIVCGAILIFPIGVSPTLYGVVPPEAHRGTPATLPATVPAPATRDETETIDWTVSPAALPVPALKYELQPNVGTMTEGDAAPIYRLAFMQMPRDEKRVRRLSEQRDMSISDLSLPEAKALLAAHPTLVNDLEVAGRCEECRWNIPFREAAIGAPLIHLNPCRQLIDFLCVAASVDVREGHVEQAIEAVKAGFGLVRHLKTDAMLVQGLVGTGNAAGLLWEIGNIQQYRGAPNLYWALALLSPRQSDLWEADDRETAWMWYTAPALRHRSGKDWTDEEFRAFYHRMLSEAQIIDGLKNEESPLMYMTMIAQGTAPARAWLLSHRYTQKDIDNLTAEQAVRIYFVDSYRQYVDEIHKWKKLPYWEAAPRLAAAERSLIQFSQTHYNPLLKRVAYLRVTRYIASTANLERQIAIQTVIEALRDYAAGHGNQWPKSLSEIQEIPVPSDPMTGEPFEYRVSGATAILASRSLPLIRFVGLHPLEYRLTIRAN